MPSLNINLLLINLSPQRHLFSSTIRLILLSSPFKMTSFIPPVSFMKHITHHVFIFLSWQLLIQRFNHRSSLQHFFLIPGPLQYLKTHQRITMVRYILTAPITWVLSFFNRSNHRRDYGTEYRWRRYSVTFQIMYAWNLCCICQMLTRSEWVLGSWKEGF